MNLYEQFLSLSIDREALGLEPRDRDITHFCTPVGAEILGWAGVDGVHYCHVPALGETIFCVTPMDGPPYVRPIAGSFEDLLHLLLACGTMDAISQAYMMDERRFARFIAENLPTPAQQAALDRIQNELAPTPWDDPYAYIRLLQETYDYTAIPYTEEYYDLTGEMPPAAWAVYWNKGFSSRGAGTPGEAVPVNKTFRWGDALWHIPAVYRFPEGLMIDFCIEVEPDRMRAFIEKWDLLHENEHSYTKAQRRQIEQEHPLAHNFKAELQLCGQTIRTKSGFGCGWIAPQLLGDGFTAETETQALLDHYGLDRSRCWNFRRATFPHEGLSDLRGLTLQLSCHATALPADTIDTPKPGDILHFTHPLTGEDTAMTILEAERQTLSGHPFPDPDAEYPTHFTALTFTLDPDRTFDGFRLLDTGESDPVRRKTKDGASAIGIIGGASAPALLIRQSKTRPYVHTTCSALRFKEDAPLRWEAVFYEKLTEPLSIELL